MKYDGHALALAVTVWVIGIIGLYQHSPETVTAGLESGWATAGAALVGIGVTAAAINGVIILAVDRPEQSNELTEVP